MKILILNIRGLQKVTVVTTLVEVQKRHNLCVVFIMDSHLDECPAGGLRRRFKMDHKEVVRSLKKMMLCCHCDIK